MAKVILDEPQYDEMDTDRIPSLRVYVTAAAKRAVVVKEDDLLTKKDIADNPIQVAQAMTAELKIWTDNHCFEKQLLSQATNVMTSRYVYKWKFITDANGTQVRTIRLRLVLRGFMDTEAFDIETFSGTARRSSQKILASEAACHPDWILASLDIDKAFLKGLTYQDLAAATGKRNALFVLHYRQAVHKYYGNYQVLPTTMKLNTAYDV